jgi:hypothetical protein
LVGGTSPHGGDAVPGRLCLGLGAGHGGVGSHVGRSGSVHCAGISVLAMVQQVREHCRGLLPEVIGAPGGGHAGLAASTGTGWMMEEFELLGGSRPVDGRGTWPLLVHRDLRRHGRPLVVARHAPCGAPSRFSSACGAAGPPAVACRRQRLSATSNNLWQDCRSEDPQQTAKHSPLPLVLLSQTESPRRTFVARDSAHGRDSRQD